MQYDNAFDALNVCFILCIAFQHYLSTFNIKLKRPIISSDF